MDEQIKPVAWRAKTPHGWVVGKTQHSSYDEPLYSQQSIDALRAEVDEQCRLHAIGMERELALIARAERAEAEAEALRADAARYRWIRDRIAGREHIEELVEFNHDAVRRAEVDAAIDADRKEAE